MSQTMPSATAAATPANLERTRAGSRSHRGAHRRTRFGNACLCCLVLAGPDPLAVIASNGRSAYHPCGSDSTRPTGPKASNRAAEEHAS